MNKRNIFLIGLLIGFFTVSAQRKPVDIDPPYLPIDEHTHLITYQQAVRVEGNPDSLYTRALAWAKKYYKNPTQVIKEADAEAKTIECVSNIRITTPSKDKKTQVAAGYVYYNLKIEMREGRYRYTITNFNLRGAANQPIEVWFDNTKPEWSPMRYEHLKQVDEAILKLTENLEEEMEPKPIIHDDW
ncbi:MAG: DUF4468 domain-containing protein [Bacteroidales bacterium]|nr:DUF4468 domain-containing protein [Bacteroidales bacterium]